MCLAPTWPRGGSGWAAVGVLTDGARVLLIKRAERQGDPWSGQIAFPGGMWRVGETLLETAQREVREEVGVSPVSLLGVLEAVSPSNAPHVKVVPFVFAGWEGEVNPNPLEVQEVRWISPSDVVVTEWSGRPAYRAGDWVIWGLTYRILKTFWECKAYI